jgi:hypothetical protein
VRSRVELPIQHGMACLVLTRAPPAPPAGRTVRCRWTCCAHGRQIPGQALVEESRSVRGNLGVLCASLGILLGIARMSGSGRPASTTAEESAIWMLDSRLWPVMCLPNRRKPQLVHRVAEFSDSATLLRRSPEVTRDRPFRVPPTLFPPNGSSRIPLSFGKLAVHDNLRYNQQVAQLE